MKKGPILIVEDDPDDETLTLRALRKSNLETEVVVLRDGAAALDYLFGTGAYSGRELPAPPQLILLDLNLGKMSGMEVLRRLRADSRTRLLPIVVLTSSNEERELQEAYRLGANSFIRKPVEFAQFMEAVRQVGLYWLEHNKAPGN